MSPSRDRAIPVIRQGEFVALMATLICLVALSIDAMLPALADIGRDLGVADSNDTQLVVTVLFAGLALGQLLYGPASDATGRKTAIYAGLSLFCVGCLLSIVSWDFNSMLAGRFLQGLGAAAPRIVTVAVVRDRFEGRNMARVMSFIMAIFILVPALAPALGQVVLLVAHWRAIFWTLLAVATIGFVWMSLRLTETLPADRRLPFSLKTIWHGVRETVTNRIAFGYTVSAGLVFGAFIGYLSSAQQIFQVTYDVGEMFPFYFGVLALAIGAASVVNGRLVVRWGMRWLSLRALIASTILSTAFCLYDLMSAEGLTLAVFVAWGLAAFFCMGILFGNFNALAMEPLGHIAGVAAAVVGSLTTFISLGFGLVIGRLYDGTTLPLVAGFAALGLASILVMFVTDGGRRPDDPSNTLV